MIEIEEVELEPSLGNGGLGRLAACFIDSIATLGLNGDGVGLNYHFGLFQQVLKNNQQETIPNAWLTEQNWLVRSSRSYQVPFAHFTLTSTLYDIDVPGYKTATKNRLRLFDLDSVDSSIIEDGINFDKTDIARNLTLFLYPDDSNRQGELTPYFPTILHGFKRCTIDPRRSDRKKEATCMTLLTTQLYKSMILTHLWSFLS